MERSAPTSQAELAAAIDALVQAAHDNGVEVATHGYDLRHEEPTYPDWEVTITRLESQ